ncbi:MAG: alpha/beta hydrolase fold domain-containing protein [Bacteroidales bacterium]|nr:alpha/beta hydrolase fold domain-containing protein [Bacteroidales bacterium]
MRLLRFIILLCFACGWRVAAAPLSFDATAGERRTMTAPDGRTVPYTAYENIFYITEVEDSTYQTINIFIPDGADGNTPIFLKTNVGGYMASAASQVRSGDVTGRALAEGYVVAIPGCRGRNAVVTGPDGRRRYTGKAPAAILDLKAAVRYLRANDSRMPGNAERIVTDGTSAGGALSALLGATGNHPDYVPMLRAMGAADARDDIFAAVCFCPITDLEHADMSYEWLFSSANAQRRLSAAQTAVSEQLTRDFSAYLHELQIRDGDGAIVTESNYIDFIGDFILASAKQAVTAGATLPADAGFTVQDGRVTAFDVMRYLEWMAAAVRLKTPPAFDAMQVAGGRTTPENDLFGDSDGTPRHFTDFGLQQTSGDRDAHVPADMIARVRMMNPMGYIEDTAADTAPHWYIRHGSRDGDTAFTVPANLYAKLQANRYDVNFRIAWDRPHSGDYDLDELFAWLRQITAQDR